MSSKSASHTWMAGDSSRQARFGSTSGQVFETRRQIDRQRSQIGAYANSELAHQSTSIRGEIVNSTRKRLEAREKRFGVNQDDEKRSKPILDRNNKDNLLGNSAQNNRQQSRVNAPPQTRQFYPDFGSRYGTIK
jgi:hypothetical protein